MQKIVSIIRINYVHCFCVLCNNSRSKTDEDQEIGRSEFHCRLYPLTWGHEIVKNFGNTRRLNFI